MDIPNSFPGVVAQHARFGQDEVQHIVEAANRFLPIRLLVFSTVSLVIAFLVVMGIDVSFVFHLLSERAVDIVTGSQTSPNWLVGVESGVLLLSFFVISEMVIRRGWPRIAGVMLYIAVLAFLAMNIIAVYSEDIRQLWGSTSLNLGGGLGTMAIESADPPIWFSVLIATIFSLVFSMPGVAFSILKRKAIVMKEKWAIRSEASAVIRQILEAKKLRMRAKGLRTAAESALKPRAIADAARAVVVDVVGVYFSSLRSQLSSNVINMTDARGVQQQKKKVIDEANDCLIKAQSIDLEKENHHADR